jgi:hypothetical protein
MIIIFIITPWLQKIKEKRREELLCTVLGTGVDL